jgi:hypothetical protein
VSHESKIFTGDDSQIYGRWEYLFTDYDNIGGGYTKIEDNRTSLNIEPYDNYVMFKDNTNYSTGKIDTLGHLKNYNYMQVIFYPDGKITPNRVAEIIYVIHSDTLVKGLFAIDAGILDYYKRIK